MITKDHYIESIRNEVNVIKHLHTKVPKDKLDYRPTPQQRSMQELLEYLPCNLAALSKHLLSGDWTTAKGTFDAVKQAARADFPGTMDREAEAFIMIIQAIPEAGFATREIRTPMGTTVKLGTALLDFHIKFLAGYKMQLFLYLKSCGLSELSTSNCWRGMDPVKK
ncbi:MAG TPA: hypothetical protein VEK08_06465 [Planctomycetota bacterium]|nr:hypothetical protein [Planctomycetota bacterium]